MSIQYKEVVKDIDLDALYEAIGFEVLETQNDNDMGHCFDLYGLHKNGDTTGKLGIHRIKKVYNCFVCGGGDLRSLVMETQELDSTGALYFLDQFSNSSDEDFSQKWLLEFSEDIKTRREVTPYFNEKVLDKWSIAYQWAQERAISREIAEQYNLKYADAIERKIKKNDESYIGPCVIIPHYWKGRLVGWQHRWLEDKRPKWVPKYTNTSNFPRKETIYGLEHVDSADVIVVESVPTVMYLASQGYAAVATFGSNVTNEQLRILRGFKSLSLAPDNDSAGTKWVISITQSLEKFVDIYQLPVVEGEGSDLGDYRYNFDGLRNHIESKEYSWAS